MEKYKEAQHCTVLLEVWGKQAFSFLPEENVYWYNPFGEQFVTIYQNFSAYKLAYVHKALCRRLFTRTFAYQGKRDDKGVLWQGI